MLNFPHGMFVSEMDIKKFSLLPSNHKNRDNLFGRDNLLGRHYIISDPAKNMIRERKWIIVWLLPYHN